MLPIRHNPYATPPPGVEGATVQSVTYAHAAATAAEDNTVGDAERRGFRLQNGVVEIQLGAGNWQALTDPATLKVTRLDTTTEVERVGLACHRLCSAGATPCPPELELRSLSIAIAGQAVHDPAVQRAVRVRVKLRNDAVVGECRE
jgi:type IV pilus assembly protein PilW